jgi:hypothetical protein
MIAQDIISIIIGILGIGGVIFTIYNSFKNPQTKIEKDQIKAEEDLKDKATILSQKEVESKAQLLAQQFQWEKEANEKRFCEMVLNLKEATTMAQNHIHTVDVKCDGLKTAIEQMGKDIVRLTVIIDERIPKK